MIWIFAFLLMIAVEAPGWLLLVWLFMVAFKVFMMIMES